MNGRQTDMDFRLSITYVTRFLIKAEGGALRAIVILVLILMFGTICGLTDSGMESVEMCVGVCDPEKGGMVIGMISILL